MWIFRASFPRIRFDQLMSFSWTAMLPIVFAFIILVPCISWSLDILPANSNIALFGIPLVTNKNSFRNKFRNMLDAEFRQWFVGFVDAEGSFIIDIDSRNNVTTFKLSIGLHIEDLEALFECTSIRFYFVEVSYEVRSNNPSCVKCSLRCIIATTLPNNL